MAVYIDDRYQMVGTRRVYKMTADSLDELLAMARKIDQRMKWLQATDTPAPYFTILKKKRTRALKRGAIRVSVPSETME